MDPKAVFPGAGDTKMSQGQVRQIFGPYMSLGSHVDVIA